MDQAWKRCISLLQRCSDVRHLEAAHALFLTNGLHCNTFALSRLILTSCSVAPLSYASLLFRHAAAPPNSFIYNTLIRAHSRSSQPSRALPYFLLLRHDPSAAPDHHTFPFVLIACASLTSLAEGAQIHALVFKNGLASADHFVQTALLRLYEQSIDLARKVFDEIPHRDAVHWDVLMNGYLRRDLPSQALSLFRDMLLSGQEPDAYDITTALTACSHAASLNLKQGLWIHQYIVKNAPSFLTDTYIGSALVSMYAKCGCISKAITVFDSMPEKNTYLWSAMIGGLAMHGFAKEAIGCLDRMQAEDGVRPDGVVLLCVLTACAHAGLVREGLLLLASMEASYSVVPMHEHYSCAVDMLCRVGQLDDATELIGRMPMRPLASVWGSLLAGCKIYGNVELAEMAVEELQRFKSGDDEGAYVQLSNIYLNANKRADALRVRKLIGSRGIKKTAAASAIEVDGEVNSFVAGDQAHPHRLEIWRILNCLTDHISHYYFFLEKGLPLANIDADDRPLCGEWE